MSFQHSHDDDWTAFRYLYGELDQQQEQLWVERLSSDPGAQEAMARIVRLTDALGRVLGEPELLQQRRVLATNIWVRAVGWLVPIAAAALLFLFAYSVPRPHPERGDFPPTAMLPDPKTEVSYLANAWLQAHQTTGWNSDEQQASDGTEWSNELLDVDLADEPLVGVSRGGANIAPSWLMLAVVELHGGRQPDGVIGGRP